MANARQLTVQILDKEYRVACQPEEEGALHDSARLLNQRMQEIRDGGRVVGIDRIAVMAALNLAHELLQGREAKTRDEQNVENKIRYLRGKLETALNKNRQMEL